MLWRALVLEGDASFDKHQHEDFLQMCVMAAPGDDIRCLWHYHHHLILLTFRCNGFVYQCVCMCVQTSLRYVFYQLLQGCNYHFNLEDCVLRNTIRLLFLSLSLSATAAILKDTKQHASTAQTQRSRFKMAFIKCFLQFNLGLFAQVSNKLLSLLK